MKLKSILEGRKQITEEVVPPSEQLIKMVQKEIKAKTGITCILSLDKSSRTALFYSFDLTSQIRTPVMNALFETMALDVTCQEIPNSIGGYVFKVDIDYTHPGRGSNGIELGTIWIENGKVTSRFRGKVRKSETPY
jgi:hypothetical protein